MPRMPFGECTQGKQMVMRREAQAHSEESLCHANRPEGRPLQGAGCGFGGG